MKIKIALLWICLLFSIFCVIFGSSNIISIQHEIKQQKQIETKYKLKESPPSTLFQNSEASEEKMYLNQFNDTLNINNDFVGWIKFDNGLLNFPLLQGEDNSYYLNHNIEKKDDKYGTPFLDAFQAIDGSNLTIYGHHIYKYPTVAFGPLLQLRNASAYEKNKYFSFTLSNQIKKYVICSVVEYNGQDIPYFLYNEYSAPDWENYIKYINSHRLYETNNYVDKNSKIICFQTCVKHNDPRRFLVFAKEIA